MAQAVSRGRAKNENMALHCRQRCIRLPSNRYLWRCSIHNLQYPPKNDRKIYNATARPAIAITTTAQDPVFFVAAPVNLGGFEDPPGPWVAEGTIGKPVANGPVAEPAPEPDGEVPVGAAVPVAKPVEPATPVELRNISLPYASNGCEILSPT